MREPSQHDLLTDDEDDYTHARNGNDGYLYEMMDFEKKPMEIHQHQHNDNDDDDVDADDEDDDDDGLSLPNQEAEALRQAVRLLAANHQA